MSDLHLWILKQLPPPPAGTKFKPSALPSLIKSIEHKKRLLGRHEFDSYGQGAASFIDAWFYRETAAFRVAGTAANEQSYNGLFVLFSLVGPYVVMGEGAKSWGKRGGIGYMPSFSMVNQFKRQAVASLATGIEPLIETTGLVRLNKPDLAARLPFEHEVETNLAEGHQRLFDALFFWID
ncbi:MAG: hypothetical protein ACKVP7_21315 [Hyphomicrobiaceae bacterium]